MRSDSETISVARFDPAVSPAYRLYGVAALDIATFTGSILAGFVLMAQNWRVAGDVDRARTDLLLGLLLVIVLLGVLIHVAAFERIPDIVFQGIQVWMVHVYASRTQAELRAAHRAVSGRFHSKWRGFWLGLAVGFGVLAALFAYMLLAPESWFPID